MKKYLILIVMTLFGFYNNLYADGVSSYKITNIRSIGRTSEERKLIRRSRQNTFDYDSNFKDSIITHKCEYCGESISKNNLKMHYEMHTKKIKEEKTTTELINELKKYNDKLTSDILKITDEYEILLKQFDDTKTKYLDLENKIIDIEDEKTELENKLNLEKNKIIDIENEKTELKNEKTELESNFNCIKQINNEIKMLNKKYHNEILCYRLLIVLLILIIIMKCFF